MKKDEDDRPSLTWSKVRYKNAIMRDFTVNSLLYEPCSQIIYDYVGGLEDLRNRKLRCIQDPYESFKEDPARILRAIRFASRLGLLII